MQPPPPPQPRPTSHVRRNLIALVLVLTVILATVVSLILAFSPRTRIADIEKTGLFGAMVTEMGFNVTIQVVGSVPAGGLVLFVESLLNGTTYSAAEYNNSRPVSASMYFMRAVSVVVDTKAAWTVSPFTYRFTLSVAGVQVDSRTLT